MTERGYATRWQSGDVRDCNSRKAGSTPARVSI